MCIRDSRILDRAHGDGVHHLGLLFGREVAVAALQQGAGALFRFVQQVNQLDGAAGAGLVGTAVLAQHHAEGVVQMCIRDSIWLVLLVYAFCTQLYDRIKNAEAGSRIFLPAM